MTYPKAIFDYSLESQARYICFLAKGIVDGIYQKGNFTVLPYQVPGNFWTVYFPDLDYSREFWQEIAKTQHDDYSKQFPKRAEDEVLSKLKINLSNELESSWNTGESEFWKLCKEFLDWNKTIDKVKEVRIMPTSFGTFGSYHPNISKSEYLLSLSTRSDTNTGNIVHLLLLNLYTVSFRDASEIGEIDWYKRQAVTEYLAKKTSFSKLFSITKTGITTGKHVTDSNLYLSKLGFPQAIDRNYNLLENILTTKERVLFNLLKIGKLTLYDEIGDALWPNQDDKFSLYAITKLIEGLRQKMRTVGLDSSILKTSKGQGYFLS